MKKYKHLYLNLFALICSKLCTFACQGGYRMEIKNYRIFTRAALLLSLTILFQSLRLFIPMPPVFSTFLIGSLVNACLLVTVETVGLWPALMIGAAAPVVAWFQQLLPVPVFIFPVALANLVYVTIFFTLRNKMPWFGLVAAAAAKTLLLYMTILGCLLFSIFRRKYQQALYLS